MKKPLLPLLICTVMLAACAAPAVKDGDGKIGVMVTILPQQEFVSRVGGDKVDVTVMVPPGANPPMRSHRHRWYN